MKHLKTFTDKRGSLTLLEVGQDIPFPIERVYWIYDVPREQERGKHANRVSYQYLVAVSGCLDVCLEDANGRRHYHLTSKSEGLLVPPATWNELSNFSPDAVLIVLASHPYNQETYINSYEEFLDFIKE